MQFSARAIAIFLVWVGIVAGGTLLIQQRLIVSSDLRLFLPPPVTPQEHLLLNELGEGPASRVLVVALSGASVEQLAAASRDLRNALAMRAEFRLVANGETSLDDIPESLLPYRYVLTDSFDAQALDAMYLRAELTARAKDLASPAGADLESIVPRDPTLELLKVAAHWQPTQEPRRVYDVWFDRTLQQALLIVETAAPAFDPGRQESALATLEDAFAKARHDRAMRMEISGSGAFSKLMQERTQRDVQFIGVADTIGMIVLMLVAYRRPSFLLLGALPLASAGVTGLLAIAAIFGAVHGITLAFGFTLLGVAQDYPMH